ncbi:hypothetical protein ABIB25_004013 [Nakamurella sp. UYEF19]|uniref:hypothetical protein n=1 Tax=Nakamurella sp. UYEF19 TaxID=1756392 RepID=UPI003399D0B9
MIVGVAVCPGAPFLVAGLAPALERSARGLSDTCAAAVARLAGADRILLITSGPRARDLGVPAARRSVLHPSGTTVTSAPLTDSRLPPLFEGRLAGGSDLGAAPIAGAPVPLFPRVGMSPGVGVIVGAALLAQSHLEIPTVAIELAAAAADADAGAGLQGAADAVDPALDLLHAACRSSDRVALLVVADGSASRGPDSPGGGHLGAAPLDAALAAALASGSPRDLADAVDFVGDDAGALLFTSGPAFAALADLTAATPPGRATLFYDDAPLGIGYLVATWSWS